MADFDKIVRDRQKLIRREIDRRRIAIKSIQLDGGWKEPSTVLSYFPADPDREPSTMSVASLYRLIEGKALPADLLSLLLPDGWQIVRAPENVDHDAISDWAETYNAKKLAAHRKDSECEELIGPKEHDELTGIVLAFPGVAAA